MKSYCTICNRQTNQLVLQEVTKKYHEEETGWWEDSAFQIIQCAGCDEISFRKLYNNAQAQSHTHEDTTDQELYPQRGAHSRPIKPYRGLPLSINTIYRETIDSFNGDLTLLCSVGVRAIIEAICLDKLISEGKVKDSSGKERVSKSLDGKISGLSLKGFLTPDNVDILHELRFLGNESVHKLYKPPISELALAIDIIELVLENIYIIRKKAFKLKESRESRKS